MAKLIELTKYECHNWYIYGYLKVKGLFWAFKVTILTTAVSYAHGTQVQNRKIIKGKLIHSN